MKKLIALIIFISASLLSTSLIAAQSNTKQMTPLETHYINILLGKWHSTRLYLPSDHHGQRFDLLKKENALTLVHNKTSIISDITERKLILNNQYLMIKFTGHLIIIKFGTGNEGTSWMFNNNGIFNKIKNIRLKPLPQNGVREEGTVNNRMLYIDVYPQGHNHLRINISYVINGKITLIQRDEQVRAR